MSNVRAESTINTVILQLSRTSRWQVVLLLLSNLLIIKNGKFIEVLPPGSAKNNMSNNNVCAVISTKNTAWHICSSL